MGIFRILLFVFCTTFTLAQPLHVDNEIKLTKLLPYSQIYVDKSRTLKINNILNDNIKFEDNDKSFLGYGFSPNFDVWIKFTLKNISNKHLHQIIEYANPLTTHVEFYDSDSKYVAQKDGLFNINPQRKTLNPIFNININPGETKTYYIKASSYITTLIINLNIWESANFYKNEVKYQFNLALFFGAMMILGFFNLFIFLITRDMSYLFYVLYIFGLIVHQSIYVGVGSIYVLNQAWIIHIINNAAFLSAFPIFTLALFTKTFLQTKQYPVLNKILNTLIFLFPFSVLFFILTDGYNKYRNMIPVIVLSYLLFITIYASFKKNRQAYFILIGWCAIFLAMLFMLLSSIGVFSIYKYFPYYIEYSLVFEAVIFSIALADRIKQLQFDKEKVTQTLLDQQVSERARLVEQVKEKTKDLQIALNEKNLLLKEVHHRVKNNMQTVVSLIRLQKDKIKEPQLKDVLSIVQNRIKSISHLHELLYKNDNLTSINAYEYFELIVESIQENYNKDINIVIDIKAKLEMDQAIYCGLILNELITNSLKYAFPNKNGTIHIKLEKHEQTYMLSVKDNGVGYDENASTNTLGLMLVKTLAQKQLKGIIHIDSTDGVKVEVTW